MGRRKKTGHILRLFFDVVCDRRPALFSFYFFFQLERPLEFFMNLFFFLLHVLAEH